MDSTQVFGMDSTQGEHQKPIKQEIIDDSHQAQTETQATSTGLKLNVILINIIILIIDIIIL